MHSPISLKTSGLLAVVLAPLLLHASGTGSRELSLHYLSPAELVTQLGLGSQPGGAWQVPLGDGLQAELRVNPANNRVLLNGDPQSLVRAEELIRFFDVAPRQIEIEARIIAVDKDRLTETGIDWQYLLDNTTLRVNRHQDRQRVDNTYDSSENESETTTLSNASRQAFDVSTATSANLGDVLALLQSTGAGELVNSPRILTTNNRKGSIQDGATMRYIANLGTYQGLYQTEELHSGLVLEVTPSLGEEEFLRLDVHAKLTALSGGGGSSLPIETGQVLDNTVVVRNGESVMLGGLQRSETVTSHRRIPILGRLIPFLFSRDVSSLVTRDLLVILTPTVVDLELPPVVLPGRE